MPLPTILILVALAASLLLVLRGGSRLWPTIALAASGVEAALAFGVLSLALKGIPLALILAAALAASGVLSWLGATAKDNVTAATVIAVIGGIQVFSAL